MLPYFLHSYEHTLMHPCLCMGILSLIHTKEGALLHSFIRKIGFIILTNLFNAFVGLSLPDHCRCFSIKFYRCLWKEKKKNIFGNWRWDAGWILLWHGSLMFLFLMYHCLFWFHIRLILTISKNTFGSRTHYVDLRLMGYG